MGPAAVPTLIIEMKTNDNWQIPKALGTIRDSRAVLPLIDKLEQCDWSPMRDVVAEALNRITGKNSGANARAWRDWWTAEGAAMHKTPRGPNSEERSEAMDEETFALKAQGALAQGDLVQACDWKMQRVLLRKREGHPYKDKIGLSDLYETLVHGKDVSNHDKQVKLKQVQTYLAEHKGEDEYEWRIHHLISTICRDLGRDEDAAKYLDLALSSYPDIPYRDPSKHSKFQHLVNERAEIIWDVHGVEAAENYVVELLKTNVRFDYFFDRVWRRRYDKEFGSEEGTKKFAALVNRIKQAYRERKQAFPNKETMIDRYLSSMPGADQSKHVPREDVSSKRTLTDWFLAGSDRSAYEMGPDDIVTYKGTATRYLMSTRPEPAGFGTMMKNVGAEEYRGKRVRMSAYVKSENVETWTALWMRVDGEGGGMLSFDNMGDRPIAGTTDWTQHEIVLDVPENSAKIAHGILLGNKGKVWIHDLQFEVVGNDVSTTGQK